MNPNSPDDHGVTVAADTQIQIADAPIGSGTSRSLPTDAPPPPDTDETRRRRARRLAIEWLFLIALAVGIALVIRAFLFQAFYIPSGSMEPTLNIGDRVIVNKLSYSFGDLERGDIVVFEAPVNAGTGVDHLVKRAIGLPGDTVEFRGGKVFVNGKQRNEPYLQPSSSQTQSLGDHVPQGCGAPPSGLPGCVVPVGRVFVMGDNRIASKDARVFGPIKESTIVGRVFLRIWPLDDISLF